MTQRVAVAIDFSPESEIALREAIEVGRRTGAEVHMIHVVRPMDGDYESESLRDLDKAHRDVVRDRLADLHRRFDGQGVALSQSLIDDFPVDGIRKAAEELGCQTIVIGTHGRTGFRRFFLGSVAEKIVRTAKADVLVSRGSRPKRGYQRILVPTDFSPAARRALGRAVELATDGGEIDLVHIWQLPGPITHHYAPLSSHTEALARISARISKEAENRAAPLLEEFRRPGVAIDFTATQGSAGPAIVDRAAGCDLVVMGTHGRTGFSRFALGSIAERTVRHAPCSVLVTHTPTEES